MPGDGISPSRFAAVIVIANVSFPIAVLTGIVS